MIAALVATTETGRVVTARDYADLVGPIFLAVFALAVAVVIAVCAAYAVHEWKWARRERLVRWGGPADRTLADRLTQYMIEAAHPDEYIATRPIEPKPYYQSDPTVWDNPKEN